MTEEVYVGLERRFDVGDLFGQKVFYLGNHLVYLNMVAYNSEEHTLTTAFGVHRPGAPRKEFAVTAPCPDPTKIAVHATVDCWLAQAKEFLK